MAELTRHSVDIEDFIGLVDNADVKDLPAGAAEVQINACSITPGVLTIRNGYRPVTFEND